MLILPSSIDLILIFVYFSDVSITVNNSNEWKNKEERNWYIKLMNLYNVSFIGKRIEILSKHVFIFLLLLI